MLKEYPKVLVAIPTYEGKDYVFAENFAAVKGFDYPNYDYVYIDNSKGTSYLKKLRQRGARAVRVPRGNNSRQALCNAQNYARGKVFSEGYDYLLFVESDLIPRPDTIKRLLKHDKDVVGSLYYLESETNDLIPKHKVHGFLEACSLLGVDISSLNLGEVETKGYLELKDFKMRSPCVFYVKPSTDGGMGATRLIKPSEIKALYEKPLQVVHGVGLGCTLIKRSIVNNYVFWWDENPNNENKHSDVYFYMDLHRDNVKVYLDTTVVVPHYPSKWSDVKDR